MPEGRSRAQPSLLDRERNYADDNLRDERDVLDATLEAIAHEPKADANVQAFYRALKDRIDRQRQRFDGVQTRNRGATDDAIHDQTDSARLLQLILAELSALATTAQAIAEAGESGRALDLPSVADSIQTSTDRILAYAGDILDTRARGKG